MHRFYVANEGSGDIMVGVTIENENGWQMKFIHYNNGTMPRDILELLNFIE